MEFRPINEPNRTVLDVIHSVIKLWNKPLTILSPTTNIPCESPILTLDSTKAITKLGWTPKLSTENSITWTVDWYEKYASGENMESFTRQQINAFKIYKGAIKWNRKMPFCHSLLTNTF